MDYIFVFIFLSTSALFKRKNEFGYVLTRAGEFEHRVKVEQPIGRSLEYGEEVHHSNGKPWDNRKANLA
ncbi:MAG: HNH endonuclease [Bacteriovorax sp.]|nr:HNH endonuclease [Bacteriovorax sp.]